MSEVDWWREKRMERKIKIKPEQVYYSQALPEGYLVQHTDMSHWMADEMMV